MPIYALANKYENRGKPINMYNTYDMYNTNISIHTDAYYYINTYQYIPIHVIHVFTHLYIPIQMNTYQYSKYLKCHDVHT